MGTSLNGLTPAGTYPGLIKTGDNAPIDGTLKTLSDGNGNNLPMAVSTTAVNFTNQLQQSGVAVPTASQVNAKQDTLVSGTNIKTINGTSVLGSGNIVTPSTNPSGVAGAIQFSNGSAFASDANNLFWDNTNKRLGIGTNAPTQALDVVGQSRFSDNVLFSTDFKHIGRDLNNSSIRFASVSSEIRANISTGGQFHVYNAASGTSRFGVSAGGQTTISGGGSTSATTSLLVQNSAGTQTMKLDDSGRLFLDANNYIGPAGEWVCSVNFIVNGNINNSNSGYVQLGKAYSLNGLVAGTTTLNASAILEGNSTTKGFLPPRMTTTQKNAIASPAAGLQVYDTTTNKLCCYNGSTWNDLF